MIYEYECPECGYRCEENRKVAERDVNPPLCHEHPSTPMRRTVGKGNFLLKGGGWYKDGYQKSGTN